MIGVASTLQKSYVSRQITWKKKIDFHYYLFSFDHVMRNGIIQNVLVKLLLQTISIEINNKDKNSLQKM